ncbi:flagellar hook-length control protein FliK [Novosphingobium sp. RD2P27]|uniref:Flagellar hook-length control protein FliK n=1 Tax=Novosphingobium kalidii TaxID=3230299 RepID=A0ABV2CXQ4_9SPHN
MEIAATGMLSHSAANTGANVSEGGPAFAAVLGEVETGTSPAAATVATPAPVPVALRTAAGATNMPLLASAATVQTTSAGLAHGAPAAGEQALLAMPGAVEMQPQPDLVASGKSVSQGTAEAAVLAAAAEPSIMQGSELALKGTAGPTVSNPGATPATKASGKPEQKQVADLIGSLTALDSQNGDTKEPITAPQVSPETALVELVSPDPADEMQTETAAVPAALQDAAWMPVAAPTHQAQEQGAKAETKSPELSLGGSPQAEAASGETATGTSTSGDDSAATTGEPFARMVSSAAPERPQQQTNAPGPQPMGQAASQAVGQQAQPALQPLPTIHAAAESHPTMSFRADKVAQEMGLEIARRVSMGSDELVIRLDPAELGRINIRMTMNEQGQLRAVVAADAPGVLEAIRADIPELSRALEQAGVRTDSQSFRFDRGSGNDSGNQWQQRYQQQQAGTRSDDSSGLGGSEDPTTYRPMATNGRINMMA